MPHGLDKPGNCREQLFQACFLLISQTAGGNFCCLLEPNLQDSPKMQAPRVRFFEHSKREKYESLELGVGRQRIAYISIFQGEARHFLMNYLTCARPCWIIPLIFPDENCPTFPSAPSCPNFFLPHKWNMVGIKEACFSHTVLFCIINLPYQAVSFQCVGSGSDFLSSSSSS